MSGQGSITLKDAYEIFYLDNKSRRLTPATVAFYRATLLLVFRWLKTEQVALLSEVTAHHIRKFLTLRQEAGLSTYTQHKYARALRTFFRFCVREGLLVQSPMATVTMPRVEKLLPTSFTEAEVKSILDECTTERDKAIVYVLLDTGVRASELLALNAGDVDIKQCQITVLHGKGQKQRVVYFGAKTRRQLLHYFAERDIKQGKTPVFVSETTGQRLTLSGLFHLMTRLRERTGIAHLQAHTFRRTFALWSLRAGMSIYHLQRLMGHEDIKVLQRYLGLVENDLAEAHRQYGAVDTNL